MQVIDDGLLTCSYTLPLNEQKIVAELNEAQGDEVELGGYYRPDPDLASKAMRPSHTFNQIIARL